MIWFWLLVVSFYIAGSVAVVKGIIEERSKHKGTLVAYTMAAVFILMLWPWLIFYDLIEERER